MIEFIEIENIPDDAVLQKIEQFCVSIFGRFGADEFYERVREAENLHTILALHQKKIVGFKLGYKIAPRKFYSWLGGVDAQFRNQGIAAELMHRQHDWCVRNGFEIVQTKTRNSFKAMLILNIKSGFDIIEVYSYINNELKIVLEKNLKNL